MRLETKNREYKKLISSMGGMNAMMESNAESTQLMIQSKAGSLTGKMSHSSPEHNPMFGEKIEMLEREKDMLKYSKDQYWKKI